MAKVKEITASYAASAEIRGVWHKIGFAITLEVEENDDTAEVKEKAWNTCLSEVEKQFGEITGEVL